MAINKYTRSAQASIQKTQVLPDFNVMNDALMRRQQKYDINSNALQTTVSEVSKMQFVGDKAKEDLAIIDSELKSAASSLLTQDLSDPKVSNDARERIYAIKNNPTLIKHQTAKIAYDKYQEELGKLSKEGSVPNANIWEYEKAWGIYSKYGEFNPALSNPIISKGVDRIAESKKLFDIIKENGRDTLQKISSEAGSVYYENGWKGITGRQVDKALQENLNTMIMSPYGAELAREYRMLVDMKQTPVNTKNKPIKNEVEYIVESLKGVGNQYVHSETKSGRAAAMNEASKRTDDKKEKEVVVDSARSEEFANTLFGTNKVNFDEKDKFKGSGGKGLGQIFKESTSVSDFFNKWRNDNTPDGDKEIAIAKNLTLMQKLNPGMSQKDIYEQIGVNSTVGYKQFTANKDMNDLTNRLWDKGSGELANLHAVGRDGERLPAVQVLAKGLNLDEDATVQDVLAAMNKQGVNFKALGYANPTKHVQYGVMGSLNGHNIILDMGYKMKNLPDEQVYNLHVDQARAIANSGEPTPVIARDNNGKKVKAVIYKDLRTQKLVTIPEDKFEELIKKR